MLVKQVFTINDYNNGKNIPIDLEFIIADIECETINDDNYGEVIDSFLDRWFNRIREKQFVYYVEKEIKCPKYLK